jgi:1-deoxy-D-xylulose-5-phosphate reductoisomerase
VKRRIAILGATGSVGRSALDLIERQPDRFEVVAVTAATNAAELASIARRTGARLAVVSDESKQPLLEQGLEGSGCRVAAGEQGLIEAATIDADLVIAAIVGCAGLRPVMAAVEAGRVVALANKEALVTAGHLMMSAATVHKATLLPIEPVAPRIAMVFLTSAPIAGPRR